MGIHMQYGRVRKVISSQNKLLIALALSIIVSRVLFPILLALRPVKELNGNEKEFTIETFVQCQFRTRMAVMQATSRLSHIHRGEKVFFVCKKLQVKSICIDESLGV